MNEQLRMWRFWLIDWVLLGLLGVLAAALLGGYFWPDEMELIAAIIAPIAVIGLGIFGRNSTKGDKSND